MTNAPTPDRSAKAYKSYDVIEPSKSQAKRVEALTQAGEEKIEDVINEIIDGMKCDRDASLESVRDESYRSAATIIIKLRSEQAAKDAAIESVRGVIESIVNLARGTVGDLSKRRDSDGVKVVLSIREARLLESALSALSSPKSGEP